MEPAIPPTVENISKRGHHWRSKEDKPRLWENTTYWADTYKKMEQEILKTKNFQDLPWNQTSNPHSIRYQAKCIWIHLYLCDLEGTIKINWAAKADDANFFHIEGFRVLDLVRFNNGMFPLPSGWREHEGMRFRLKTLIVVWQAVGMVETYDVTDEEHKGMHFDHASKRMIKQRRMRADDRRYLKNQTPSADATSAKTTPVAIPKATTMISTTLAPIDQTATSQPTLPSPLTLLSTIATDQAAAREAVRRAQDDYQAATRELQKAQLRANAKHAVLKAALEHLASV